MYSTTSIKNILQLGTLLLLMLAASCSSPYKHLHYQQEATKSAMRFKPEFTKSQYKCTVDGKIFFKKIHLDGDLYFKEQDDKKTRAILRNSSGFSFFDFEWNTNDSFHVVQIFDKLNKPFVVNTLQRDLNLLLMKQLDKRSEAIAEKDGKTYSRFKMGKNYAYYISSGDSLNMIANSGKRKDRVKIDLTGKIGHRMPENATFRHRIAHLKIQLTKAE